MIKEHDRVVLARDLPEHRLVAGDLGTVVLIHNHGEAFEVEFCALDGATIAIVTLRADEVTELGRHPLQVSHARAIA